LGIGEGEIHDGTFGQLLTVIILALRPDMRNLRSRSSRLHW
jgi:hypothetical protein